MSSGLRRSCGGGVPRVTCCGAGATGGAAGASGAGGGVACRDAPMPPSACAAGPIQIGTCEGASITTSSKVSREISALASASGLPLSPRCRHREVLYE